jgi:hypothetical protein
MKHPIITVLTRLSNITIKVYDFHIIMYFYIGANYAKQSQFSEPQNDANSAYTKDYEDNRRKIVMKKQTQFKANKAKNKADSNPITQSHKELAGRIMFLLFFFVNMGCGYADKNV